MMPTVTQIIGIGIDKDWFTDEARDRGTAVHNAAAAHLLGLFVPPLPVAWRGYYDSFLRFADRIDRVILVETRMKDVKLGFTGKPDLVCVMRDSEFIDLPDYKTAMGMGYWWPWQLAAYDHLSLVDKGIKIDRRLSVRLRASGKKALVNESRNYVADWNMFMSHFNVFGAHPKFQKED